MAQSDLTFRTLTDLVKLQTDFITANAPSKLTTPLGPFITAVAYSVALVALVLQRLIQLVLKAARLNTATGDDVDSFVADFGVTRAVATPASGAVIFGRFASAISNILIPDGSLVQTNTSPPVVFQTVPDLSQPNYDSFNHGYILTAGSTTCGATVQAIDGGVEGNVAANTIVQIASAISGIDTVTNGFPFINGLDAENDAQLRIRFIQFIQALSRSTPAAIGAAVLAPPRQNYTYFLSEPGIPSGTPTGVITVIVDDGTGSLTSSNQSAVQAAVNAVRPAGVRVDVTAAVAEFYSVLVRVGYDVSITPDVVALQKVIRSAVVNIIDVGRKPLDKFHFPTLYKAIFDSASPGDVVQTAIAVFPASDTVTLNVGSTIGMKVGQVVSIAGITSVAGNLPKVQTIVSGTQFTVFPPLSAIPSFGIAVQTFSTSPDQIKDIHGLIMNPFSTPSTTKGSTTITSASTSTVLNLVSGTNFANGDFIIVTNEIDPTNIIYYQADPANLPTGKFLTGNISTNTLTLTSPLGVIGVDGTWHEANGVGTNPATPAVGTKVVAVTPTGGVSDIAVIGTFGTIRARAAGPNCITIQMEPAGIS